MKVEVYQTMDSQPSSDKQVKDIFFDGYNLHEHKGKCLIFQEEKKKLTNLQFNLAPSYRPNLFYERLALFEILHTKLNLSSKFRMSFYTIIEVTEKEEKKERK